MINYVISFLWIALFSLIAYLIIREFIREKEESKRIFEQLKERPGYEYQID